MLMYTTEMHKRTLTNKSASVLYHWMYRRTGIVHGRRMGSSPEKTIHYSLFTIHFSLKMIIGTLPAGFSIGSRKAKEAAISGVCSSDWEWFANRPPEENAGGGSPPLGAVPERKPQGRGESAPSSLILSPPLRFSLRLSFLIPPLSWGAPHTFICMAGFSLSVSFRLCAVNGVISRMGSLCLYADISRKHHSLFIILYSLFTKNGTLPAGFSTGRRCLTEAAISGVQ